MPLPSSEDNEKKPEELPISYLHRKQDKNKEAPRKEAAPGEIDIDSSRGIDSAEGRENDMLRRIKSASEELSSIYSLHIPKDVELMLWTMSLFLLFAIFIAYIYFMDRVSPWILIPLLAIPVIFWLAFTFAAYWTETRVYYLIKRTLSYDIIQTLRGYRQYVIRRKER